jgi:phosphoglycerate dehydrogenase-like enzyme
MKMEKSRAVDILILSPIDSDAIQQLSLQHRVRCAFKADQDRLRLQPKDCEVLIFRSGVKITAELMEASARLRLIIRAGSGYDNIDLEYVRRRGLHFLRIPEPGAQAVAEMSFGLMLALSRNLLEANRLMGQGHWAKYELEGYLLRGKVLGIVGCGNIGTRVAEVGVAWGMDVIGCVEHPSPDRAEQLSKKSIGLKDFREVMSRADYVSLHVPLKDSTRHLINAEALSWMKTGAYLINLARGGVVDEKALYRVLTDGGRLRGVALDVHQEEGEGKISPLAGLPNVILTPHIGAMAVDAQREIGRRVRQLVDAFAAES